jgi:hypothetical protein
MNIFKSRRGDAAIISTILLMAVTLLTVNLALNWVNATLTRKNGEADFESAKIFMKTIGLQVDDVAWTQGRVDTVRFASEFGLLQYLPDALQYTLTYKNSVDAIVGTSTFSSSIFMFNMPTIKYSLSEGYYELLLPSTESALVDSGVSAPVMKVFVRQLYEAGDSDFLRVAAVPMIRMREHTITVGTSTKSFVSLYIPKLDGKATASKSMIVLSGKEIKPETFLNVKKITVTVTCLDPNYSSNFYNFQSTSQDITLTNVSTVQAFEGVVQLEYPQ